MFACIILCVILSLVDGLRSLQSMHGMARSRQDTSSLQMASDERTLLERMRKSLGEREDVLGEVEKESKQLMQGLRESDRDPNQRANSKFVEWLSDNGVWVKTTSAWGRAPHPLVIASNTESDGESCGRGLLARESIAEGELLMTVPLDLCLTKAMAQEILGEEIISKDMDEYIAIALLLMTERLKGAQSRWSPYFAVLPDVEQVYPAFIWTEDELEMLKGSPTYHAARSLRAKLTKEYDTLQSTILTRLSATKLTYELFLWAFVMLLSRAARLTSKLNGEELALVPYADLMNHSPYSNTYIDAQRSGMPLLSRKEEVAVYADRSYKQFEQVFINYGEKGNGDLLLLYGFALDRNPFDSVDVAVGLSQQDPLYGLKKAYLDRSGRGATTVRFPLQRNRYPSELVDFLRLLLAEADDLGMQPIERTNFNEPISPSLERRVLTTMTQICQSYLDQYPTTVTEDEQLIADRGMFQQLSRQQRMAVKLRVSEKRILLQTIQAVEQELSKLPQGSLVPAGRSFDVLSSRPQQGKELKSVSDGKRYMDTQVEQRGKSTDPAKSASSNSDGQGKVESIAERRRRRRSNTDS